MGTRISKSVGLFLPLEDISKIFHQKKLMKILSDEKSFPYQHFENLITELEKPPFLKLILKNYNNKDINIVEHIVTTYNYDNLEGLLFQPIEMKKEDRHNNLIDYHEHIERYGELIFVLQHIFENPNKFHNKYIYKGADNEDLKHNEVFDNLSQIYPIHPEYFKNSFPLNNLIEDKIIEFNVDSEAWTFAQLTGCLKKNVTALQFNSLIKPVIVTCWG